MTFLQTLFQPEVSIKSIILVKIEQLKFNYYYLFWNIFCLLTTWKANYSQETQTSSEETKAGE